MLKGLKTKKTQAILIGMIIIFLSLIAIVDLNGYIGGPLAFCFVFLFGRYYFLPLILIIISGISLIKNKKYKFSIPLLACFIVMLCICIYNSYNINGVNEMTENYMNMFKQQNPPFFLSSEIYYLGGGYIGYTVYSILYNVFDKNGVNIFLLILFIICFMFALKPIINMFVNMFYDLDDKQVNKKKKKKEVTFDEYEEVVKTPSYKEATIKDKYQPTISVEDYVDKNESFNKKDEKQTSTLFMDLNFKQNDNKEEQSKVSEFNIFSDSLNFDKKEEKVEEKPIVNVFKEDVNESFETQEQEEPEESYLDDSGEVNTEEEIPPFHVEEKEVEPTVTVETVSTDYASYSRDNFEEEDKGITSINENKEVIRPISEEIKVSKPVEKVVESKHPYTLPPMSLLDDVENADDTENKNEAEVKGVRLNQKLASLNINAHVVNYVVAPSFTRFEIEVASDVKLSAFNNIKQDIMMALAAEKINILAPIPGTPYVGIEIPNVRRSVVSFKEVFKDIPFKQKNEKLLAVLGKDITGKTVTMKINDTPHLLIAGATGSGKSVCINTIIASLLMRTSYEDVKLILVDPKRVEMAVYGDIPHLLCPVINDPIKATIALNKVAEIMDERYKLFTNEGSVCRNIDTYNRIVTERGEKPLPYIVMIIDELSDLMLVAGKDVESSILRITQLARACGIHLIVATQRPSVDVITGIIKANLPSRIAFAVSTSADSRTILDLGGAEDLLGRGDSLVSMRGDLSMSRVQGAYVSDEEIEKIVMYITKQRRPVYDPRFLNLEPKQEVEDCSVEGLSTDDDDEFYDMVLNFVKTLKTVSTTALQVHFKIGYPKARRMIDLLEENGAISGPNGSKGRQVLVSSYED